MAGVFFALGGGLLLGAGFLAPFFWPLALVGLAPLLRALFKARSDKQAFGFGWLAGFAIYGCAIFGIFWHTLPLDWLGVFPYWFQILLVALSWTLTASGLALATGIFGFLVRKISTDSWRDVFIISAAWVFCEWIAMWEFSIQNAGPGSIIEPHFSLGFVGNHLAHDPALLQIAWLGGVYLLSAFVAASGVAAYRIVFVKRKEERARFLFAAVFIVAVWGSGHVVLARMPAAPDAVGIRVALLSTQEPPIFYPSPEDDRRSFETIMTLLPDTRGTDFVLVPESTGFLRYARTIYRNRFSSKIREVYGNDTLPVIVDSEAIRISSGALQSRLEYYDADSGQSTYSQKFFLLPDGEYVPYFYDVLIRLLGQGGALNAVAEHRGFVAGILPEPLNARTVSVATLFCNETMSPSLYASLSEKGASIFFNTASHSWFHGSRMVAEQMVTVAKVRSVESRRWYAQASDVAPSFVLDPYGRVATTSRWGSTALITATLYPREDGTPYTRFSSWPILVCTFLLISRARFNEGVRK